RSVFGFRERQHRDRQHRPIADARKISHRALVSPGLKSAAANVGCEMTMRRIAFPVVLNLLVCFSVLAESSAVIPTPLPAERYESLIKKSPFAPATASSAPAAV